MTKSTTVIMSLLLGVSGLQAQQLANSNFSEWEPCIPWNSAGNSDPQGETPTGWRVSNVVTPGMSAGNVSVAGKGKDNKGVMFKNVSPVKSQIIPGYMVLGKTWATAKVKLMTPSDADGGCWGGKEFTYTPDAIAFDYIRTQGSGSTQPATINAYLWKGSTSQADVPAANTWHVTKPADPAKVTMVNRDRNILGMKTILGGDMTKSADFALIATLEHKIIEANTDWQSLEIPFKYALDENPEMINIIFSAGDYFADRSSLKADDALSVNNVRMIYHSRLSDLKVNGESLPEFASNKYKYESPLAYDNSFAVVPTVVGRTAKAETKWDDAARTLTVNVKGADADSDGAAEHSYVVKFAEPVVVEIPVSVESGVYTGKITIDMGTPEELPTDYNVEITNDGEGKCKFELNHFSLDGNVDMGDIVVNDVKTYKTSETSTEVMYAGSATDIKLMMDSDDDGVADYPIYADVTLEGAKTGSRDAGNEKVSMQIHVKWIVNYPDRDENADVPIEVTFNGDFNRSATTIPTLDTDNNSEAIYFNLNGMKVAAPEVPGIYIVKKNGKTSKMIVK